MSRIMKTARQGFTLIELLVVIAIIAILAAILFPVFAQAREKARQTSCLSNMKQLGTATMMYVQDYDETLYAHRWNCNLAGTTGATDPCPNYLDASGNKLPEAANYDANSIKRYYWAHMLYPYTKNWEIFRCPSNPNAFYPTKTGSTITFAAPGATGVNYGAQNSYGHNDAWLSPANSFEGGSSGIHVVAQAAIDRPAGIVMITDGTYYGAVPDVSNESKLVDTNRYTPAMITALTAYTDAQGAQYKSYWKNIGNANWSANKGVLDATTAVTLGQGRHSGVINCQFADGHAKAVQFKKLISDFCLWSTGTDNAGLNCN